MKRERVAFTLAEVLITLGIIGIIAAITLPTIIKKYTECVTINKLKSTQSILAQAYTRAVGDNGSPENWNLTYNWYKKEADSIIIGNMLIPYLKLIKNCGSYDENGECCPAVTYKYLNGNTYQSFNTHRHYYKVRLANGASIWWRAANTNELYTGMKRQIVFFVDTNASAPPNQWGIDLFAFYADNNSVRPCGASDNPEVNTCQKNASGAGCAYYVLTSGNMNYLH